MKLAEVKDLSSLPLRSKSEDHLWFCQSENRQGWDLGAQKEGSETPSGRHTPYQKLGPRNQNSRKMRITGEAGSNKKMPFHTWQNIFAQELNFRYIFLFTSTALKPNLDRNWWQKLSTFVDICKKHFPTYVTGK